MCAVLECEGLPSLSKTRGFNYSASLSRKTGRFEKRRQAADLQNTAHGVCLIHSQLTGSVTGNAPNTSSRNALLFSAAIAFRNLSSLGCPSISAKNI